VTYNQLPRDDNSLGGKYGLFLITSVEIQPNSFALFVEK
jgi:hypothetical protein